MNNHLLVILCPFSWFVIFMSAKLIFNADLLTNLIFSSEFAFAFVLLVYLHIASKNSIIDDIEQSFDYCDVCKLPDASCVCELEYR